jgi:hypothetical protein
MEGVTAVEIQVTVVAGVTQRHRNSGQKFILNVFGAFLSKKYHSISHFVALKQR